MHIGFLGIGMMGDPMVRRLLKAGHSVTVWNRSPAKAQALAARGALVAESPADAARGSEALITMLANGEVVEKLLLDESLLNALQVGALVIDMSSIAPSQAKQHAAILGKHGFRYIDAPVSGGTLGAEAGTLAIMAGGIVADIEAAAPIFDALGRVTFVGANGCGQLVKLANQMIVGLTISAVAEALLLVERGGGDPLKAIEAMQGGFAASRVLEVHGRRMAERDFKKRASMTVQLKDLDNALQTGDPALLPVTELVANLYRDAIKNGNGELDHSALWIELNSRANPTPSSLKDLSTSVGL